MQQCPGHSRWPSSPYPQVRPLQGHLLLCVPAEGTGGLPLIHHVLHLEQSLGALVFCRDVPQCRCFQFPVLSTSPATCYRDPFEPVGEVVGPPCQRLCMCGGACGCPSQRLIHSRRLEHCDVELSRRGDTGVMGHAVRSMRGLSPPQRASARWKVVGNAFLRATVSPAQSERTSSVASLPQPTPCPKPLLERRSPERARGPSPGGSVRRPRPAPRLQTTGASSQHCCPGTALPIPSFPFPSPESWCL